MAVGQSCIISWARPRVRTRLKSKVVFTLLRLPVAAPASAPYLATMEKTAFSLEQVYAPANFREAGHRLVDQLADYLAAMPAADANPVREPEDLLSEYRALLASGTSPEDLFAKYLSQSVHQHAPTYMGHQMNATAPLTALSDLVNGLVNGSTAIFEMGRVGAVLERLVIEKFAEIMQLAPTSGGFLTNGGTLANLTALLAARAAKWPAGDPWKDGQGSLKPCVLVNEQAHYCIDRAVRIMGWGEDGIINIPADDQFRIRPELIDAAIANARSRGLTPLAIIGSAGTTSTGSFDDLTALADAAKRHDLWFHVDGAHGAPVRLDPGRRRVVEGLELADSLIMDFHKMQMTPALTTAVFFRKSADAYRTFHQKADYLLSFDTAEEDQYNIGRRTFECTKNMMSLRVYSLLACYGEHVFQDYVVRVNDIGEQFAATLRQQPDFELALDPACNIVCFRYRPLYTSLSAAELDQVNAMIRAQLVTETHYYIVQTKLRGSVYLRCTFTNPFTTQEHYAEMLALLSRMGEALLERRQMPLL